MSSNISQKYTEEALKLQTRYSRETEQVRGDSRLSAAGKQEALSILWSDTRKQMDAITTGRRTELEQRQNRLKQQLFGLNSIDQHDPAKVALMRDSIDRAIRYEDASIATAALKAARQAGDTLLVKAIVSTAFDQSWYGLIEEYTDLEPDRYSELKELHSITRDIDGTDQGQALYVAMSTSLPKPDELSGFSEL
ncbi:hypothetical protein DEJ25_09720 [Curtobacterium sp. MCPF17_011]|uniref:hypothetical protein n=1 Tax=Curtobacterium sp. MCPF17_011 TaxID=2175652 RepID=UPI000DA7905C|nr:hypothetical protein [Curtobacterium sp. MCPF17_011]PZF12095.1 hypothetical protein DEJ25_09720 [Curtobacterium sp. MCPF17_011]